MQFNSINFLIFFPIVLFFYFFLPRKCRTLLLLIASYFFYMSWNAKYAVLIATSTLATYISALLFNKKINKKLILTICIVLNLGILAVFKYGNFGIETINSFLKIAHLSPVSKRFEFLLPVGISFYTFQALGYIIDVYKGKIKAEKSFIRYALFVSFFPQLVAGPIERSENLLPQIDNIENIKLWNAERITSGAILMLWGLFMKMVIADRVAILVDTIFDDFTNYGSVELICAAIGFSIQIYCDFASYSLIAIGAAKIMGITLMENFNTPYFAISIRDFWSRWHISLTTWFRDYLYIPLGGNRKGKLRRAVNIMIVFLVSGLWHGANWTFVIWGGIHGLYHVIGDFLKSWRKKIADVMKIKTDCFSFKLLQIIVTYALVVFAWIFFRAHTISNALIYIKRIFTCPTTWVLFDDGLYKLGLNRTEFNILFIALVVLFLVDLIKFKKKETIDRFLMGQNLYFEWLIIIGLFMMILIFGEYGPAFDAKQFIYFQF